MQIVRGKSFEISNSSEKPEGAATAVYGGIEIFIKLKGLIDFGEEISRLTKSIEKLDKEIIKLSSKLNNKSFVEKAPADIVAKVKDNVQEFRDKKSKIETNLERVKGLMG